MKKNIILCALVLCLGSLKGVNAAQSTHEQLIPGADQCGSHCNLLKDIYAAYPITQDQANRLFQSFLNLDKGIFYKDVKEAFGNPKTSKAMEFKFKIFDQQIYDNRAGCIAVVLNPPAKKGMMKSTPQPKPSEEIIKKMCQQTDAQQKLGSDFCGQYQDSQ